MRSKNIQRVFTLLLSLSFAPGLYGQPSLFHFEHITVEDGLPENSVTAILQDHLGFLWFGTGNGLARYDGYSIRVFTPDEYTSVAGWHITCLYEDEEGDLWAGTRHEGLHRFDRRTGRFVRYAHDPGNEGTLGSNWVRSISAGRDGELWLITGGAGGGLDRFNPAAGHTRRYRHDASNPNSLSHDAVETLYQTRDGALWVGTRGGLNRFDEETDTFIRYMHDSADPGSLVDNHVHAILEDHEGNLWIGTERGLVGLDAVTGRFVHYRHTPADRADTGHAAISKIHEDGQGTLWIATRHGLGRFDAGTGIFAHFLPVPEASPRSGHNTILSIFEDRDGLLWLTTPSTIERQGRSLSLPDVPTVLYSFDPNSGAFLNHEHDPNNPHSFDPASGILSMVQDRGGTLWIGTWQGGVNKLDHGTSAFSYFSIGPEHGHLSESGEVRTLREDREGVLWIGTGALRAVPHGGALYRLDVDSGDVTSYRHEPDDPTSLSWSYVSHFFEDSQGRFWVASLEGLEAFDPAARTFNRYMPYHDSADPRASAVNQIVEDGEGKLWMSTVSGGLLRFDPETGLFKRYRHVPDDPDSIVSDWLLCIRFDREEMLWIGTVGGGLVKFDPRTEAFTSFRDPEGGLISPSYIHEDAKGRLWVGTRGNGLVLFDRATGGVTAWTTQDGLANNVVQAILEDDNGHLWISTVRGLSRFNPETGTFWNYDASAGLQGHHFESRSAYKAGNGDLYFGGRHGLNIVHPERMRQNLHPPQVVLTGLRIFGKLLVPSDTGPLSEHISTSEEIRLSHRENDVTFEFVGLHFSRPERNRYAYMLDGYEGDWRHVGAQRSATYANLPPGRYRFRVKAANYDGVWNEDGLSLRMIIVPPWWQRSWFYALCALGLLGLIYAGYQVRVRHLKIRSRNLQEQVSARTRELMAEKQKTEEQTRRLEELDEAKSRFFANISHEFRTPLTLIISPLEDGLEDIDGRLPERFVQRDRIMLRSARRLLRLVNQLLDLSKLESGKVKLDPKPGDISAFLRGLVRGFTPLAERRKIALQFHPEAEIHPVVFDRDALEKVFANLLSNALKFTPEGGKVWVTVHTRREAHGDALEMVVKDTGPGIPAASLGRLFNRFEQVDASTTRSHEGTGLGLALARELVELHGGTLRVESELGFGSAFIVRLPLNDFSQQWVGSHVDAEDRLADAESEGIAEADADSTAEPEAASTVGAEADAVVEAEAAGIVDAEAHGVTDAEGDGTAELEEAALQPDSSDRGIATQPVEPSTRPTVLIVDDNPEVRQLLHDYLKADYRVLEEADGLGGLEAARKHRPELVLCDVMMPGMDGNALCRAIKSDEVLRRIPVMLLTAKASQGDRIYGLEGGADDYLTKPFSRRELQVRISNLILSRRELRRQFSREILVKPAEVIVKAEEEEFLERVLGVLQMHLSDSSFTTDVLADRIGLSRRQAERRVKDVTGETPPELLRRMRLERAAQLLKVRPGSISEVAYAVGFKSPSHFSHAFRKEYGVSPSEHIENMT